MVYDSLIVMAIAVAYGALLLFTQVQFLGATFAEGEKARMGPFGFLGLLLVISLFFCLFWRRGGQTLGMRAWRLQVISDDGSAPSWRACLVRCLLAPLSLAALGIGYWWLLIDKRGATLHDRISGSRVVVLPKTKR